MIPGVPDRLHELLHDVGGVSLSGLPIPRSMMSSPRRRASSFRASTSAKT